MTAFGLLVGQALDEGCLPYSCHTHNSYDNIILATNVRCGGL